MSAGLVDPEPRECPKCGLWRPSAEDGLGECLAEKDFAPGECPLDRTDALVVAGTEAEPEPKPCGDCARRPSCPTWRFPLGPDVCGDQVAGGLLTPAEEAREP